MVPVNSRLRSVRSDSSSFLGLQLSPLQVKSSLPVQILNLDIAWLRTQYQLLVEYSKKRCSRCICTSLVVQIRPGSTKKWADQQLHSTGFLRLSFPQSSDTKRESRVRRTLCWAVWYKTSLEVSTFQNFSFLDISAQQELVAKYLYLRKLEFEEKSLGTGNE